MNAVAPAPAPYTRLPACLPSCGTCRCSTCQKFKNTRTRTRRRLTLLPCTPVASSCCCCCCSSFSSSHCSIRRSRAQIPLRVAAFVCCFTWHLFWDAMRLQIAACYVLKLVCNIFVSAEREKKRERGGGRGRGRCRAREIHVAFLCFLLFFTFHSYVYF